MATTPVALDLIKLDGKSQSRVETNKDCIAEYAEAWKSGVTFPPVDLFTDGNGYHVGDGIHRILGAQRADRSSIPAIVHKGGSHEAAVFSAGANKGHGLRRTNEDKRKCVKMMLELEPDWSDRKIAEHVGVHHSTVADARKQLADSASSTKRLGKDGKTRSKPKPKETGGGKTPTGTPKNGEESTDAPAGAAPVSKKITGGTAFNPEELESEPPPEKDEWGADVQPHATEAFKACPKFDELLKLLRECQRLYLHLPESDGGKFLQSASITSRSGWRHAGIVNAIRDLEDCKPAHTLCPYSVNENQKHGKDCPLCHGLNWTPKIPKGRVPERLITKAKKTLNV